MPDADVLFHAHRHHVFRYLCRMIGAADAASDLTQEVFLRVSRTPAPGGTPEGCRAWLFRIARNLALNHLRDGRRRPAAMPLEDAPRAATQELSAALDEALAALEPLDRDVFLLRETAGLSYQEIAAACELTPDAVRSRLHRARLKLRDQLAAPVAVERSRGVRLRPRILDGDGHD